MRPIDKSLYKENDLVYDPYGSAKDDLLQAIGNFCSYCEREGFSSSLDVEHIDDKKHHAEKKFLWSNFLLACKNCNSIKGKKEIDYKNIILPHINNTFEAFTYLESGLIIVSSNVSNKKKIKALNLISLVGLDRVPSHPQYSNKDHRWEERKKCWVLSNRYLVKYQNGNADIETIKDLALSNGFWSIWMYIFRNYYSVKSELIKSFLGTDQNYL